MNKILILEDNIERINWFKQIFKNNELHITKDISSALLFLSINDIDIMFLDHDLDIDNLYSLNNGVEFCKNLIKNNLHKKALVYIHSMNPVGANVMLNLLNDNGYEAQWIPFRLLKLSER